VSDAPGAVAKAFLDALPALDFKKLVDDARRPVSIVVLGDAETADQVVEALRSGGTVPPDSRLQIWRHTPGEPAPKDSGKPEAVIAVPATADNVVSARNAFSGTPLIPVVIKDVEHLEGVQDPVFMPRVDRAAVRRSLVPRLAATLRERRLALGRGLPATRRHIAWRLTQESSHDPRVVLGSVAGAGAGRNGAPTAATAQLLMHQAALIVAIAAASGWSLDDKVAIFRRAATTLLPTLLLDGAEAGISKLAAGGSDRKHGRLYGQVAAYVARPALSASSTLLAGALAQRTFHEADGDLSVLEQTRRAGKKLASGAGQSAAVAITVVGERLHLPGRARPASDPQATSESQPAGDDVQTSLDGKDGAPPP
jgi:hypothetical protein